MASSELIFQKWHPLARLGLFALAYACAVRLCGLMAFQPELASALWLPSGVVLAAMLLSRGRDWPWLALTCMVVEPLVYPDEPVSLIGILVAGTNALEGLTGAFVLRRWVRLRGAMERVRDVVWLMAVGLASTLLSASVGVALMALAGKTSWNDFASVWRVFWVGDAMGVLVLAPLLLAWAVRGTRGWDARRGAELAVLLVALALSTNAIFQLDSSEASGLPPRYHLVFPLVLWAAVRFEARGATLATAVLSGIALWHSSRGHGPFSANPDSLHSLTFLQSFLATVGASGLLMAAALAERHHARDEVASLNAELRESLETLARAQAKLVRRERLAALGELAATVAHEVRNPLGAIANALAGLRRLVRPAPTSDVAQLVGIIDEEVQRLDELVSGLLDYTRPVEPRRVPQPLEAVMEGALTASLRATPSARVTVVRQLEHDVPPVPVDAQLMHVALSNLFTNALQAMPEGGTLTMRLSREERAGAAYARLAIQDTGRGITPEVQGRIFEPFFTTRATGTGLGLAIVRRMVEAHSGEVEVHSTPGQGTTFVVHLPCAPASASLPAVVLPGPAAPEEPTRKAG